MDIFYGLSDVDCAASYLHGWDENTTGGLLHADKCENITIASSEALSVPGMIPTLD